MHFVVAQNRYVTETWSYKAFHFFVASNNQSSYVEKIRPDKSPSR